MSLWKDILTDDQEDLKIQNGDFVIGDSDGQNIKHLILAAKGEYKFDGLVGVDAQRLVKSSAGYDKLIRETRLQVKREGRQLKSVQINGSEINVDLT